MYTRLLFATLSIALSFYALEASPLKVSKGKTNSTLSETALRKLKSHTVSVIDPNESTPKKSSTLSFNAYKGEEVLDLAFGGRDGWAKSKNINFECADGYRPSLETKDFLKGGFYFAVAKQGSKDFSITNNLKDGKKAELAPYYIVWTDKNMQTKEKAHNWPYQVVGIGLE